MYSWEDWLVYWDSVVTWLNGNAIYESLADLRANTDIDIKEVCFAVYVSRHSSLQCNGRAAFASIKKLNSKKTQWKFMNLLTLTRFRTATPRLSTARSHRWWWDSQVSTFSRLLTRQSRDRVWAPPTLTRIHFTFTFFAHTCARKVPSVIINDRKRQKWSFTVQSSLVTLTTTLHQPLFRVHSVKPSLRDYPPLPLAFNRISRTSLGAYSDWFLSKCQTLMAIEVPVLT